MRKCLPLLLFLSSPFLFQTVSHSQSADRFAWAITDVTPEGGNWGFLRKLDLRSGKFSEVMLNGTQMEQVAYDAATKKELSSFTTELNRGYNTRPAFSSGVAAMAYDKRNNRLWYTPMFIDQLRYIDLKTMKVFYFNVDFTGLISKTADQGNIITRMTIGEDGTGYAMTNDAAHLIRFSTGKDLQVTDLGNIIDAPENKGVSIHSSCTSFGGDMIADDDGNLYVFSARNSVFKINVDSRIATHLGTVKNLPENFTTNGAAVTAENKIILASAVDAGNCYLVNPDDLTSMPYTMIGGWRSSDLANGNILQTKKINNQNPVGDKPVTVAEDKGSYNIQVYPNPVTDNSFRIQFTDIAPGNYTIQIRDVLGRQIVQRIITLKNENRIESIQLDKSAAKGFYLINIIDSEKRSVMSKKVMVQ